MGKIISFEEFTEYRNERYFRTLFLEKYLYVKLNIDIIYGATYFIDKTGALFYQVLESILLEDNSVEFTKGYLLIQDILKKYPDSKLFSENADFYTSALELGDYFIDKKEYNKYKLVNIYFSLDSKVSQSNRDTKCKNKKPNIIWQGIKNNEFIDNYMYCLLDEYDISYVTKKLEKGISYYEDKRY